MADEINLVKISDLPAATTPDNQDVLAGVQTGDTKQFSFGAILAWIKAILKPADIGAVPVTRKVNNKALVQDIDLTASDVGAYELPSGGIPSSDLASAVQTSLGLADTAYQLPSGGIPGSDLASGVVPAVPAISTTTPNMDGTGAAGSTGEVSDAGHVHPTDTSRVPVYGMGENLLDNADFANPVNQRGQSSYTGANTYNISRWKTTPSAGSKVEVSTGAVTVSETGSSYGGMLQIVPKDQYLGKTITLSVLYKRVSGGVYNFSLRQGAANNIGSALSTVTTMPGTVGELNLASVTVTVPSTITASNYVFFAIHAPNAAASVDIIAAKLELGIQQTLAHLEGSTWVRNSVPDYEQELIRCQTSTADPSDTYANKSLATEQQLAYVETGTTASRAYSIGEFFCWNGLLYRATAAISSGGTFTPGTNCEQATVGEELYRHSVVNSSGRWSKQGNIVVYNVNSWTTASSTVIPEGYRPKATVIAYAEAKSGSAGSGSPQRITFNTNGSITLAAETSFLGTFMWFTN